MRSDCNYTDELAARICDQLADGLTLREICRQEGMPDERAVRIWAEKDYGPGFRERYETARLLGYRKMADELLEISDDGRNDWVERQSRDGGTYKAPDHDHIHRSRLRVDTRKWILSKMLPKIYGDKLELGGPDGSPIHLTVIKYTDGDPPDTK